STATRDAGTQVRLE
nr:Chain B, Protein panoramix [Drosophila melanogaster]